jgi:hypothetical protein
MWMACDNVFEMIIRISAIENSECSGSNCG